MNSVASCSGACHRARKVTQPVAPVQLPRRTFIRTVALMSAGSWLAGRELESIFVADVRAQSSTQVGVFRLNLDSFPALKQELGSVRLKVTGMPTSFPNIIVTRQDGNYFAVTSRCTHESQLVNAYSAQFGSLRCPTHGSEFSPDGTVQRGPAVRPLTRYTTSFDGDKIVAVEIPGLGFDITTAAVLHPSTGARRLRIEFPSVTGVRYGVRFRSSLESGDWAALPFATAIDGPATTNELNGNNTRRSVFVDPVEPLGFYAVTRTS